MSEAGIVNDVKEDTLEVLIPRSSACRGCHICAFEASEKQMVLYAANLCGAVKGDTVEIEIQKSGGLSASLLLYGAPLLCFLIGILAGSTWFDETGTLIFALGLTALGYAAVYLICGKLDRSDYLPRAVRIIRRAAPEGPSENNPEAPK